jgi:hypothetical protein
MPVCNKKQDVKKGSHTSYLNPFLCTGPLCKYTQQRKSFSTRLLPERKLSEALIQGKPLTGKAASLSTNACA